MSGSWGPGLDPEVWVQGYGSGSWGPVLELVWVLVWILGSEVWVPGSRVLDPASSLDPGQGLDPMDLGPVLELVWVLRSGSWSGS